MNVKHVHYEITQRCNLICPGCYNPNSFRNLNRRTSNETISTIAQALNPILNVHITGGEPFAVREKLFYFLESLKRTPQQKTSINTNMLLITKTDIKKLKKNGKVRSLLGSYHSYGKKISIPSKIKKSKLGKKVKLLVDYGFDIAINMPVTSHNYTSVYDIGQSFTDLGIKQFSATPITITKDKARQKNLFLDKEKILETLYQLYELEKNSGVKTEILRPLPRSLVIDKPHLEKYFTHRCQIANNTIAVSPNGNIRACFMFEEDFGSLLEEPLEKILERIEETYLSATSSLDSFCSENCIADVNSDKYRNPEIENSSDYKKRRHKEILKNIKKRKEEDLKPSPGINTDTSPQDSFNLDEEDDSTCNGSDL